MAGKSINDKSPFSSFRGLGHFKGQIYALPKPETSLRRDIKRILW
jgi:hypothetical protein